MGHKIVNGEQIELTPEEELEIQTEWDENKFLSEENERLYGYKNERLKEYPSLVDQLDMIFHNGIDVWREKIKEIKNKYPKPIS